MIKKYPVIVLCITLLFCVCNSLCAEESDSKQNGEQVGAIPDEVSSAQTLPDGCRGIVLGTDIGTVKEQLQKDSEFGFRGERDVSLLLSENRSLIETAGPFYIRRAWFQFHNDSLYIISVAFNTEKIDFYSFYTSLVKKYGEPVSLNPHTAVWENDSVRMILERPLTVRYISLPVFTALQSSNTEDSNYQEQLKDEFIGSF